MLAALLALSAAAVAQDDEIDCDKAMAQPDLNYCANKEYQAADAELNTVWKAARAAARKQDDESDDGRSADAVLLASQRGWIAYRDGQCELARYDARGGTMEPMLEYGCLAAMTRARTKELQQFIEGP